MSLPPNRIHNPPAFRPGRISQRCEHRPCSRRVRWCAQRVGCEILDGAKFAVLVGTTVSVSITDRPLKTTLLAVRDGQLRWRHPVVEDGIREYIWMNGR